MLEEELMLSHSRFVCATRGIGALDFVYNRGEGGKVVEHVCTYKTRGMDWSTRKQDGR